MAFSVFTGFTAFCCCWAGIPKNSRNYSKAFAQSQPNYVHRPDRLCIRCASNTAQLGRRTVGLVAVFLFHAPHQQFKKEMHPTESFMSVWHDKVQSPRLSQCISNHKIFDEIVVEFGSVPHCRGFGSRFSTCLEPEYSNFFFRNSQVIGFKG